MVNMPSEARLKHFYNTLLLKSPFIVDSMAGMMDQIFHVHFKNSMIFPDIGNPIIFKLKYLNYIKLAKEECFI